MNNNLKDEYEISQTAYDRGFLIIPYEFRREYFPLARESVLIKNEEGTNLTFDPIYGRLYGFKDWFREKKIKVGEKVKIKVIIPEKQFSFELLRKDKNEQTSIIKKFFISPMKRYKSKEVIIFYLVIGSFIISIISIIISIFK